MRIANLVVAVAALAGTLSLAAPEASAMPVAPIAQASADAGSAIQDVRLVCGPFRCVRRFGYYRRPYVRGYYRRPLIGRVIRRVL